jgi:hypothetical protein
MNLESIFLKILGIKKLKELELFLSKDSKDLNYFKKEIAIIFSVGIILTSILIYLGIIKTYIFVFALLLFLPISFFISYNLELLKEENRQKTIENSLQDILLQASLFPKGTEITKILEYIVKQKYTYVSLEFNIALKQIKKGYSVEKSLNEIILRNKSKLFERVIKLLIIGYKSGKDMQFVFNKISQYILKTHELERERYSSLAIQKYTLILASAILVPLILGWIQSIISQFDFTSFQNIGVITPETKLIEYAKISTKIYLFELSLISSYFIAIIDGNKKRFIFYALIILPLAFFIFWIV